MLAFPPVDLVIHVHNLLIGSLNVQFQSLESNSKKRGFEEGHPLVGLVDDLQSELELYHQDMDVILCGCFELKTGKLMFRN
jgi:hypothetical protein